jgi:hypothetical protein
MPVLIAPESARNISFVGYSDMNGRGDGAQVMVSKRHAFVCNLFSAGITVVATRRLGRATA